MSLAGKVPSFVSCTSYFSTAVIIQGTIYLKKGLPQTKTNVFNIQRALTNILKTRKMCKEHEKADYIKGQ